MTPRRPTQDPSTSDQAADAAAPTVVPDDRGAESPADIAALSYEAARDQLVDVVRRLESGQGGLEESIRLWERGEALATQRQQWLDGARERLDRAVADRGRGADEG